jgi:ABC-type transport system substrate-binding protein
LQLGIVTDGRHNEPLDPGQLVLSDLRWDGLTALSESGTAEPALAEAWDRSDDGKEWTFEIDSDATFANGDPVTPEAVRASLEGIIADASQLAGFRLDHIAGYADFVSGEAGELEGIETSAGTVMFRLTRPSTDLDQVLASPALGVRGAPAQGGTSEWNETVTAEARPFFEREAAQSGAVTSVTVHTFEDVAAAQQAVASGAIDWLPTRVSDSVATGGETSSSPSHVVRFLAMNATSPKLDTVGERLAVALGVDTSAVRDTVWGSDAQDLAGLVPAGVEWDSATCGTCRFAPDIAEQFAGDTTLRFDHPEDRASRQLAAEVAEDLNAVGIDVELRAHNSATFAALLATGDTELYLFSWVGVVESPHSYIASLAGIGSADNLSGLPVDQTPAALALTDVAGAAELDDAMDAVERELLDAAVLVPLAQMHSVATHSDRVLSHQIRLDGALDLGSVRLAD